MQVDDDVRAVARLLVQCVEVLRGEQREHAGFLQFDQCFVRGSGLRVPYR